MSNTKDPALNLYNPAAQDPEQLLAEFIDRRGLLEKILAIVRGNTPDRPQQHLVLIGPRGMGKTTLLCAIKHSVERDQQLETEWLPILLQEEQYGIGDLADFWLECLRHLKDGTQAAGQLLLENPDDLAERAQQTFFELLAATGKRAILLADNLNEIFAAIGDDQALHSLRALWMTDPRMMVIGAAPSYFEEITEVDQVFHDFFRTFSLERLTQTELEDFLRHYAEIQHDDTMLDVIENAPERVAALRILTGGNPRLVKLGYRVLREGLGGDLRHDLERMLDETTPFFKHRIDSLSKEARRTFDAIARRWDPVTVDDIRRELRKPSNSVSVQIKRLIDEGFVEEAYGSAKKKSYQVSERFYNVYYLMRHSREGRHRVRWLVGFMQTFYSSKDYKHWAKRLEGELSGQLEGVMRNDKLAYLHALSAAADDDSRIDVFEVMVRDALVHDDRRALDEEIREGDPVKRFGYRYLLTEVLWLLPKEQRQLLGFRPSNSDWLNNLHMLLLNAELLSTAEKKLIDLLGEGRLDNGDYSNASAVIFGHLLNNLVDAEAVYRKVLELEPDNAKAWFNLGTVLNDQCRYTEAEVVYYKALELEPEFVSAWYNLGIIFYIQHRYQEAEATCKKILEINPEYINAWNNLGGALANQGFFPEAETALRKALELDSEYSIGWRNLGYVLGCQDNYSEAEVAFRKALELDSADFIAWKSLGNTLDNQHCYTEAEIAFRKAIELKPEDDETWNNLGNSLYNQKRYPEAEASYLKALEINSQGIDYYYNIGNSLYSQSLYEEAETAYRKELESNPEDPFTWNNLGLALDSQHRYLEAESAYRKTLKLDACHQQTHINLAGLYLIEMELIEAGIAELLKGLQLNPDNEYGRYLLSQYWQSALPPAASKIAANEAGADNLRIALTEELITQAASGAKDAVLNALLALDDNGQAIFEPLLLALQAQSDRTVLYRIAREKRDLVLDVMARIDGT